MFDDLSDKLQGIFSEIKGQGKLEAENIEKALFAVRRAFLEADVSLKATKLFLDRVRHKAVGERVVSGITASQKFTEIVHRELTELLGGVSEELNLSKTPSIIMLLGLQGAGKTTSAAKLALSLKKLNKSVLLVALDRQRPAAIDQLTQLGAQIDVPVFSAPSETDPLVVAELAVQEAQARGYQVLIFDTAGRLQVDTELMAELLILDRRFQPQEKLLVVDALIGQEAARVAETFQAQIGLTGTILTKLDGDSRGGAALSIVESTGKKIKLIGLGEKIEPLEAFDPERMAGRILGFGDIVSLVKSVEESIDASEAKELEKKMRSGKLDFSTFLSMQRMIGKMGNLAGIFSMLGMNKMLGINKQQREELFSKGQDRLKKYEYAIGSMTLAEREKPELIQQSRLRRIAIGSGLQVAEVSELLGEFKQISGTFAMLSGALKPGSKLSPAELMGSAGKLQKQNKAQAKSDKGGPFGGGAFMKF